MHNSNLIILVMFNSFTRQANSHLETKSSVTKTNIMVE